MTAQRIAVVAFLLALALLVAPWFVTGDPLAQQREFASAAPDHQHWFGYDEYGRDVWVRFWHGGRWSVLTGLAAAFVSLALAWLLGAAAGVWPRMLGTVILWVADLFLCVPWVFLLLAARAALPLSLPPQYAFLAMLVLLAATGWARPARLVRARVLEASQRGYAVAARGFGVPEWLVLVRHVLPATGDLLAAQAIVLAPRFVLAEVTLSYLGAGAGEAWPSWGSLILPVKQVYLLSSQWQRLLPLLAMVPFFAVFALWARAWESRTRLSR